MSKFDFEVGFDSPQQPNGTIIVPNDFLRHEEEVQRQKSEIQKILEEMIKKYSDKEYARVLQDIFKKLKIGDTFKKIDFTNLDDVPAQLEQRLRDLETLLQKAQVRFYRTAKYDPSDLISVEKNSLHFSPDWGSIIMRNGDDEDTFSCFTYTKTIGAIDNLNRDNNREIFFALGDIFTKIIEAIEEEGRSYSIEKRIQVEKNNNLSTLQEYKKSIAKALEEYKKSIGE